LIAELVRVEKEGGRISGQEMVAMVFLLLGAGTETTTHLPCPLPRRIERVRVSIASPLIPIP